MRIDLGMATGRTVKEGVEADLPPLLGALFVPPQVNPSLIFLDMALMLVRPPAGPRVAAGVRLFSLLPIISITRVQKAYTWR